MAKRSYKFVDIKTTLEGALENGRSEIESLQEEMSDWQGNLESGNMEHISKYDEVSECADALEQVVDLLSTDDLLNVLREASIDVESEVSYQEMTPYGKRGPSRSMRRDNACAALSAACDAARELVESYNEKACENDEDEIDTGAIESAIEEIESARDEAEGVSFPGMY